MAALLPGIVTADLVDEQKVPSTMEVTGLTGFAPPVREWLTNGGIMQFREFYQPHSFILTIGENEFIGYTSGFEDGLINVEKNTIIIRAHALWLIVGMDGGFEGNIHFKAYDYNFFTATWDLETIHIVAQGFGDFEGQTLKLSYEGPQNGLRTGYCLKG